MLLNKLEKVGFFVTLKAQFETPPKHSFSASLQLSQTTILMTLSKRITLFLLTLVLLSLTACGTSNDAGSSEQADVKDQDAKLEQAVKNDESEQQVEKPGIVAPKYNSFIVATGSVHGVYYPVAGAICRLVNRNKAAHKVRCSVESTGGSVQNLRDIRNREFQLAVAQSDWQYRAVNGTSTFKEDGPDPDLRAVFALEADPIALLVRKDSDIQTFADILGKRVSFGYQRSLQNRTLSDLFELLEWKNDQFASVSPLSDAKEIPSLCEDQVDVVALLTSSLTDHFKTKPEECELKFIAIEAPEIGALITQKPFYRRGEIEVSRYIADGEAVESFGLGATFVAPVDASAKAVYQVTKEVVENFDDFKSLHPSLSNLSLQDLPMKISTTAWS